MKKDNINNSQNIEVNFKENTKVNLKGNTKVNLNENSEKQGKKIQRPINFRKQKKLIKLNLLKKLSPGTSLRQGLDYIIQSGKGALIVINNGKSLGIFQGGFKINCKFTPKKLLELAKMDGSIILSEDYKKILYANTLLVPDKNLISNETGTRHQAAERIAKQIEGLVIAISEKRRKITIYSDEFSYILQETSELLRRATETLQILEKQREIFNELLSNFNILEITKLVSVRDVCNILKRLEMIKKMSEIINEYIVELGKEGIIVRMRMKELTKDLLKKREEIIQDYFSKPAKVNQFFENLSFDGLLDEENISRLLFGESFEKGINPRGIRILNKTNLNKNEIKNLIDFFGNLNNILNANEIELKRILKNNAENFKKELGSLREQILLGKEF